MYREKLDPGIDDVSVAYFVHDLSDPAVHRRVRMLAMGGAAVTPIGFRRSVETVSLIEGIPTVDLGRTSDGALASRAASVAMAMARAPALGRFVRGANAVMARNLEMLALAVRARKLHSPGARMAYECLDIHRMLLSDRLGGRLLRRLETGLWRHVDLLVTSSPAFERNYFRPRAFPSPIRLIENKVLDEQPASTTRRPRPPAGPPWRIGWFGMIRCRRSLDILRSLASRRAVEVVIRGRPSTAVFPDFEALIAASPGVRFAGAYRNPADLASIHEEVHFTWAIDYFEEGQNSSWLLPNRLYEGSRFGAVPIALADVETGRWLAERDVGVLAKEPVEERLSDFFRTLDGRGYSRLANGIGNLPPGELTVSRAECRELVAALCTPGH